MTEAEPGARTPTIAESIAESAARPHVATTYEHHDHVRGPFFHGTRTAFADGALVVPGHPSNYQDGRISNHVYFSALLEPAVWAAELATALAGIDGRGHVYVVEPTGPFEDDPNVTDKKFPGNVTRSYRTREPLRVLRRVDDWEGHRPEVLREMLQNLASLRDHRGHAGGHAWRPGAPSPPQGVTSVVAAGNEASTINSLVGREDALRWTRRSGTGHATASRSEARHRHVRSCRSWSRFMLRVEPMCGNAAIVPPSTTSV